MERGVALLAVLWVIVVAGMLGAVARGTAHVGVRTTQNRLVLAKARWAAEACLAIATARRVSETPVSDTVDLGSGIGCRLTVEDAGARLELAVADSGMFARLLRAVRVTGLRADTLATRLVEARRQGQLVALEQLSDVEDLQPPELESLRALLTVDGPGTINVNAAPFPLLRALPGISEQAARELLRRRRWGRPVRELADLAGALRAAERDALLAAYGRLVALTTTRTVAYRVEAVGVVRGFTPVATLDATLVPTAQRLALTRRRMR